MDGKYLPLSLVRMLRFRDIRLLYDVWAYVENIK